MLTYILTQILTAYTIIAVLRLREEESAHRAELVLSTAASRIRYAASHLLIAFVGSAAALALFGFCSGDFASSITRLPAVWLVAAVTIFLFGLAPRAAAAAGCGLFGALLLLEFLWEIKYIGNGLFLLSPFAWVYPGMPVSLPALSVMLLAAACLVVLSLTGFSRRDIIPE